MGTRRPTRRRMTADLLIPRVAVPDPLSRPVRPDDQPALAVLMLAAYRGTADDEGEGPDEATAEIHRLFGGGYGTFDMVCSES